MSTLKKEASKPAEWKIRFHDDFFKDLDRLSPKDISIFEKKKTKIIKNPERQKHLSGGSHCYREPIRKNIRLVYFIHKNTIWFLTVGPHGKAYTEFKKRLYLIRIKYGLE